MAPVEEENLMVKTSPCDMTKEKEILKRIVFGDLLRRKSDCGKQT
jgi:hypothetical protein